MICYYLNVHLQGQRVKQFISNDMTEKISRLRRRYIRANTRTHGPNTLAFVSTDVEVT